MDFPSPSKHSTLSDQMLMQPRASNTSVALRVSADSESVPALHGPVESAEETAMCCFCLDDSVPRGNG